jgi:hypothetical protein
MIAKSKIIINNKLKYFYEELEITEKERAKNEDEEKSK